MKKIGFVLIAVILFLGLSRDVFAAGIGIQGPNISPTTIQAGKENTLSYVFTLTGTKQDAIASCNGASETNNIWWHIQVGRAGSAQRQVATSGSPIKASSFPMGPINGTFKFTPSNSDTTESFQVVMFCDTTDPNDPTGSPIEGRQFSASGAVTVNVTGQQQGAFGISFDVTQPQNKQVTPSSSIPMSFALSVNGNSSDIQNRCGQGIAFIKWLVAMYPANQNDNFSDSNLINSGQIDTADFGSGKTFPLDFSKTVTALNQDFVIKARAICSGSTVLTTSSGIQFNAGGSGPGGNNTGTCGGTGQPACTPIPAGKDQSYTYKITNPLAGGPNNLFDIINIVTQWIIYITVPLAVLWIMYAGFLMLTAGPTPANFQKGRDILKYTVMGLAIIFIGKGFVSLIISVIELGGTGNTPPSTQNPPPAPPAPNPAPLPAGTMVYGCYAGDCTGSSDPSVYNDFTELSQNPACLNTSCAGTSTNGSQPGSTCGNGASCIGGLVCKNNICQNSGGNFVNDPCLKDNNCKGQATCDLTQVQIVDGKSLGTCVAPAN